MTDAGALGAAPARPPLTGLRVLDLTRVLAGPTCTQLLSDLGAEVIKIERPGAGDDTRGWGPPFLKDAEGRATSESAYFLAANRGKKSVAIDLAHPEGQGVVRALAAECDIAVENFKPGDLDRRGLGFEALAAINPGLIWCAITGFGQTGPLAGRPGYDFVVQGMGGIMSLTGEPDGRPMKTGVGVTDIVCGLYGASAILAALHARRTTGRGQFIDMSLFDSQVAWLINQGVGYLTDGVVPPRRGNDHPTIVPYGVFPGADAPFIIAVGNDAQFRRLCALAGRADLGADARFARNTDRVLNRATLIPLLEAITAARPAAHWLAGLEAEGVPCAPINDLAEVFAHPQTRARDMKITLPHPLAGAVDLIGNPIRLSDTPVAYAGPPPLLGEHTREVLGGLLGLGEQAIASLESSGAVASRRD